MKIFAEIGIGNGSLFSTEIEQKDSEFRIKKLIMPEKIRGIYLRIWTFKKVLIISSNEGIKFQNKPKNNFKFLFGISGESFLNNTKKSARGIIIQDKKLLTIKRIKNNDTYWTLPGGGVEKTEDILTALKREILEELGVEVTTEDLYYIYDFKKDKKEEKQFFFFCKILKGKLGSGKGPEYSGDKEHIGEYIIEWIALEDLKNTDLRPKEVKNAIIKDY